MLEFPTDRPHLADLTRWIARCLPDNPPVEGPVEMLRVKRWGITATYRAGDRLVVVKDAHPPLFPHAAAVHRAVQRTCPDAVAPLLADCTTDAWQRTIFEFLPGTTVDESTPKPLALLAGRLGTVQAQLAAADLAGLPHYELTQVGPDLLADLSTSDDQPAETVDWLAMELPRVQEWASELAELCPASLDHPDANPTNALVSGDRIVVLDWEEAVVGSPMMSLYRLLVDAREAGIVNAVRTAYLAAWNHLPDPERALDLALLLAPLKLTIEARYARRLGMDHPHQHQTAKMLTAARRSWTKYGKIGRHQV
ncbi:MAG: hypothetical protein J2P17_02485 [Mycobacterium sp.]|nr:hypothetical protein [Mycobacterium sp.]